MSGIDYTQNFEIVLSKEVEKRIKWLTKNYSKEISAWLGGEIKEGNIIIDDLLFPEQEVSGASMDTDQRQLIKLRKEYGDRCLRIIGHWHSHNTMLEHWSNDDEKFIEEHMHGRDLRVFLVSSTSDGIRTRLEIRTPLSFSLDKLEVDVDYADSEMEEELKEVIENKVVESKVVTTYDDKWWDKYEEGDNTFDFRVWVEKKTKNVKITGLREGECNKIEDMFPYKKEVVYNTNGSVDVTYDVNDKMEARKLRDEVAEFVEIIKEAEEKKQIPVLDQEDYYYQQEEFIRNGGLD